MKWIIVLIAIHGGQVIPSTDFFRSFYNSKIECEDARKDIYLIAAKLDSNAPKQMRIECRLSDDMT